MRIMTKVSTLAVTASMLIAASAVAQPPDKQSRKQGGKQQQGRPVVMPSGPRGGSPGFQKGPERREERREKNRGPAQSFTGGREAKSDFSQGGNRPQFMPRSRDGGASPFSGGGFEPSRQSKQQNRAPQQFQPQQIQPQFQQQERSRGKVDVRESRKSERQGQIQRKNESRNSKNVNSAPGFAQPPGNAGPQIKPRNSSESAGSFKGGNVPQVIQKGRDGGSSRNVISGQTKGNFQPPAGLPGSSGGKANVQPRGASGKSGYAPVPGLSPGQAKQASRGKGAPGSVIPKGHNLPAGIAGKGLPPGLSNPTVTGKGNFSGGPGPVIPKGVARGLTGDLPPGLTKGRLIPGGAGLPGLSGKPVVLPNEIRSSAVSGFQSLQKGFRPDKHFDVRDLGGHEKSVAIGLNIGLGGGVISAGYSNFLSGDDAHTYFGGIGTPLHHGHGHSITKRDIVAMRGGYLPDFIAPPVPGFGYVRPPVLPAAIYGSPGYLPPALHVGVDVAPGFSFNYWDGRSYYDHAYASNLFVSVGHTRHDGYDGALVGGRYYAFGYGWMDGCINYGQGRVWVPGFWAPQPVTECRPVPVWMPPVYEDVWTGCCWETIQVGGGHFAPAPVDECHVVTRHVWVPGHYEYYYA